MQFQLIHISTVSPSSSNHRRYTNQDKLADEERAARQKEAEKTKKGGKK